MNFDVHYNVLIKVCSAGNETGTLEDQFSHQYNTSY